MQENLLPVLPLDTAHEFQLRSHLFSTSGTGAAEAQANTSEAEAQLTEEQAKAEASRAEEAEHCAAWAASGECTRNAKYMMQVCRGACTAHLR